MPAGTRYVSLEFIMLSVFNPNVLSLIAFRARNVRRDPRGREGG